MICFKSRTERVLWCAV